MSLYGSEWETIFKYLTDPNVSEMQANGPGDFFIKKNGRRLKVEEINLASVEEYYEGLENNLVPLIKSIYPYDRNVYLYEGAIHTTINNVELQCRGHIVLSPASDCPQVTITKKSKSLNTIDSIAQRGSMSEEMLLFLKQAMKANLSTVISGSTGAGKTTMLEALTKLMPYDSRIGVAEDIPELNLIQDNVTYLHSVPWRPGFDPNNVATLSWCVSQFQRMRVDRIIVGETRGKEFSDWLTAANSGMQGSMTTMHADNAIKCLEKMANFASIARVGQNIRTINTDIAGATELIVQLVILPNGSHKVESIVEITGGLGNSDAAPVVTNILYQYDPISGNFNKKNIVTDALRKRFNEAGIDIVPLLRTRINESMPPMSQSQNVNDEIFKQENPIVRSNGLPIPTRNRSI